jgi:hypothetical protein
VFRVRNSEIRSIEDANEMLRMQIRELKKELARSKRQRNQAMAECASKKIEVGILKSTARAVEVRPACYPRCCVAHFTLRPGCTVFQMKMELMEKDMHAKRLLNAGVVDSGAL